MEEDKVPAWKDRDNPAPLIEPREAPSKSKGKRAEAEEEPASE